MPLFINLRHLEEREIEIQGEIPASELDLELRDDVIRAEQPLRYTFRVQMLESTLLFQGALRLVLRCQCVRCLTQFDHVLELEEWTRHIPLAGEEKALVTNDCVDLTPYLREDILLEFPQHPVCAANCGGLPESGPAQPKDAGGVHPQREEDASAWAELDKLKL